MTIDNLLADELNILMMFDLSTTQVGIKVHSDATPEAKAASARLFEKGLLTQADGGYLTSLGHDAAQHLQLAVQILRSN
jgi:uncharacterized protein (TIGR02647 family)